MPVSAACVCYWPGNVTSNNTAGIVWFRQDLRLKDQPALDAAARLGAPVVPVFIWSPAEEQPWPPGEASRWWLHQSLDALAMALEKRGSRLLLRRGPVAGALAALARETGARTVYFNRRYEPFAREQEHRVEARLRRDDIEVKVFNGALLVSPEDCLNKQDKPFQVFTPFWKAASNAFPPAEALPAPTRLLAPKKWPKSFPLAYYKLESRLNWTQGLRAAWQPGEDGAHKALARFIGEGLAEYDTQRDIPAEPGTARLSPHLHFGEMSPHRLIRAITERVFLAKEAGLVRGAEAWMRQVYWREFAHYLLYHFPHTHEAPLKTEYKNLHWRNDEMGLRAWRRGETGYPLVDAGMRELWATGWMHNRVRMAAASFLVKHLLIPWQEGARWFWDTLVDADLANNTLGWQWVAGCGADAAPYFRIFNPTLQGEKFDPDGRYVLRYIPELTDIPEKFLHQPWRLPKEQRPVLYPSPRVDHAKARERALAAYYDLRNSLS